MNDVIRELIRNWQPKINKLDREAKQETRQG